MRRLIALFALPAAITMGLAAFTSAAAAGDNGAQVVNWDGSVPNYQGVPLAVPVSCKTVITPSGRANQECHGEGATNPTGKVVKLSGESTGFNCFPEVPIIPFFLATPSKNWSEVITPSGQVTFNCKPE